jgi:hypothetical protein
LGTFDLSGKNLNFHSDPDPIGTLKSSISPTLFYSSLSTLTGKILWARLDRQNQIVIVLPANRGESPIVLLTNPWGNLPRSPDLAENSWDGGDRRNRGRILLSPLPDREIDRPWEIFRPPDGIALQTAPIVLIDPIDPIVFQIDPIDQIDPIALIPVPIVLQANLIVPIAPLTVLRKGTIALHAPQTVLIDQIDQIDPIDPIVLTDSIDPIDPIVLQADLTVPIVLQTDLSEKTIAFQDALTKPIAPLIILKNDRSDLVPDPIALPLGLTGAIVLPIGLIPDRINLCLRTPSPRIRRNKARI